MSAATEVTPRDEAYFNVFVTALEGGIGYWSQCQLYVWTGEDGHEDPTGFHAEIIDVESSAEDYDPKDHPDMIGTVTLGPGAEEVAVFRIDRAVIARGVGLFIKKAKEVPWSPKSYFGQAAVCLDWGQWDDLDIDATIADEIVQLGLFGKAIYG
jgi:hypothetical protein